MEYKLTKEDFDTAFEFALSYHLDPSKSSSTRTLGNARGFGGVLDSFIHGKIVEIGVKKIIEGLNSDKEIGLDFDIKSTNEVTDEPDIINVKENGVEREPNVFVEIKNASPDDRWIGLTKEQFDTAKRASGTNPIYVVGASINQSQTNMNAKQQDLLGMYMKSMNSNKFGRFADLTETSIKIEYIVSGYELDQHGLAFNQGACMYETEILIPAGPGDKKALLGGRLNKLADVEDEELEMYQVNDNYPAPDFAAPLSLEGKAELYEKINQKSVKRFLKCITDVTVKSGALGEFSLSQGEVYALDFVTLGRNPVLGRNNIWIAKRNIAYLQEKQLLTATEEGMKSLAEEI